MTRTAFITGSTSGIGLAVACRLAANGWAIGLHGLATPEQRDEALGMVRQAGAADAAFFDGDLRDPAAVQGLAEAVQRWRPVDVLVNNAGMQHTASVAAMPAELWQAILAVNLSAAFFLMQALLPGMAGRGWGRVVNIASVHGLVASVNKAPYVASKFGLVGLTKVAALEYAQSGVTVNAICPGWVETALIEPQIQARAAAFGGDRDAGLKALVLDKQPSGRMSQPSDIGEAVAMLCGDWAHNLTGVALPIDGGWSAQ
ncbi:short-chain dehydrogenase/reductase SDR [Pseudogulbenkiania sp. NH8B]|uniref:3-hydroxybutyrate dehydrogenase n=1 Tax=Pseudogulbenkiania sp. (strain NH8B) TaxID=748280 RepID=UPI00022791DD|nr:3-hydroxybutyrate dehydrogenase [Pseudogulbenkiania sp. NH8B]BAK75069.1 short-chain dehydrogenase/reductase SDR [Pseudogulbenkiania sp. NH8B]